jgi:hypothetical protein
MVGFIGGVGQAHGQSRTLCLNVVDVPNDDAAEHQVVAIGSTHATAERLDGSPGCAFDVFDHGWQSLSQRNRIRYLAA